MKKSSVLLLILIGIFFLSFGNALDVYNSSNTSINSCGNITESGTYTLQNNISAVGDCLLIQADGITIDGQGFTITGNVNATNSSDGARAFTNLVINNTIIVGDVVAVGGDSVESNGGNGGTVSITNSNVTTITASGGGSGGESMIAGTGGAVTITNSNVTTINAYGGLSDMDVGGEGGTITLIGSNVTAITTIGGAGYLLGGNGGTVILINSTLNVMNATGGYSSYLSGGVGGSITLTNSAVVTLIASGGNSVLEGGESGGSGGVVTITNSNVTTLTTNGGEGAYDGGSGGNVIIGFGSRVVTLNSIGGFSLNNNGGYGGTITLGSSNVTTINAYGGIASSLLGGFGGVINLTSSNVVTINVNGGLSNSGDGGSGGSVTITSSNLNLSSFSVNVNGGVGVTYGAAGTLKLNQTSLYNAFGEIKFSYVSTNETNFTKIMSITKNNAFVNSSNYVDYNKSANVTLLDTSAVGNDILKDGVLCVDCVLFSEDGDDFVFNVTSWSNYSIGDGSGPVVYLFPIANSTSKSRTIYYNVSDDSEIANCTIYFNELGYGNESAINKSANNSFTNSNLAYSTTYNVSVYCFDEWGNGNFSNNVTFSVGAEPVTETASAGGSGGVFYNVDSGVSNGRFTKNIDVSIKVNGTIHKLKVLNLTNSSVFFVLRSEPQNVSLNLNETKIVRVDSTNVKITLIKVLGNVAYMNISKVGENVSEGESEVVIETPEVDDDGEDVWGGLKEINYKTWGAILLVIVLVVVAVILATKHHRVKKKRKSLI